jgi:succinoglycan biosynthesis transport protein ExoP
MGIMGRHSAGAEGQCGHGHPTLGSDSLQWRATATCAEGSQMQGSAAMKRGNLKGYTQVQQDSNGLNLERALGVLRRRALVIVFCCLLTAVAAFGFSKHQTKRYTATASLVFNNNQLSQQIAGLPVASGSNQQAQQNTNLKLVQLGVTAAKTASLLGQGLSEKKVSESLSVSAQGESNIVDVAATATSPTLTADIANTYSDQFVKEQQSSNHHSYSSALALVNKQLAAMSPKQQLSPAGLTLEGRAQSLGVLEELRNGNVEVAQHATIPTSPSSPKVTRNTILGGVLGLMLGLGFAFLLERFDRRIREPKDLEAIYHLPLLGVVPESKALSRSPRRDGDERVLPPGEAEAFHLIRAHLRYFNVDRQLRTLMVASAAPGDGKTTIARHLAAAAARMGSRVLLIEVDLRRPTLAQHLDIPSGPGLSDVLIGAVRLGEVTQSIAVDAQPAERAQGRCFDVLVSGAVLPPNPGELIESHAMQTVLEEAKSTYDLIVIDTPPLTAVSDAFPLLRKVDGVIIVGRVGRNRRDVAERLHETLTGAGAPLLGVVANGVKASGPGSYAYAYDYAQAGSTTRQPSSSSSPSANGGPSSDVPAGRT